MPKCETKARILYIYKLLLEETDREHDITIQQIIDRLEGQGISAYRKTVIADIEQLKSFGADIVGVRSSQNRYYMNSRLFSLSEIKLLIDAVECSQFITPSKSAELIGKLSSLASCHNKDKLGCHIYLSQRLKSDNEDMYGVVDSVNTAINLNRQITFQYYEYDAEKNKVLRNGGERYVLSPYGMTWEDGRYYVIGFSVKHDKIITFRVDRMSSVEISEDVCKPKPDDFNIVDYVNKVFRMYDDEIVTVTLRCKNELMKSVIDRFGTDVNTEPCSKSSFNAIVDVTASQTFFGWVFQFGGDIKIVKPAKMKRAFLEMGKKNFGE